MKSILRCFSIAIVLFVGMNAWSHISFARGEESAYKLKPKYLVNNFNFETPTSSGTACPATYITTVTRNQQPNEFTYDAINRVETSTGRGSESYS